MDWAAFVTFLGESDEWLIPLLFSIIFALFSIINSSNQSKQQVTQISIELMEKRLQYYNACNIILDSMTGAAEPTSALFETFYEKTFGIEFFFGKDVVDFYKELSDKTVLFRDLRFVNLRATNLRTTGDKIEAKTLNLQEELCFMKDRLKYIFDPYLDFSCYRATGEKQK